ncbi:MAG TPA: hypothetical protein VJL28_14215 [Gemmatimonadaceae bacterium]|nr:hypothetical protein [Gemmatimonadaceae bacterium]
MQPALPDAPLRALLRAPLRAGFALPLALFALVLLAMLVALLLDGAVQELRVSRGDVALARAQAAAASALADLLAGPADSTLLTLPRGAVRGSARVEKSDTVRVTVQALGGGLERAVIVARAWAGGVRADVTTLALLRIVPDSGGGRPALRVSRLPGWWWTQLP